MGTFNFKSKVFTTSILFSYVTLEELEALGLLPPKERLEKGPVAILEYPEQIPCNICVDSCPQGAIR